jgi:hypothetical protein
MGEDIRQHDGRKRRCPMLGHEVPFSYCRAPGEKLPCRRICDCWWENFDVVAFVRAHFGPEALDRIRARHADKLFSLVELIDRAQKRARQARRN